MGKKKLLKLKFNKKIQPFIDKFVVLRYLSSISPPPKKNIVSEKEKEKINSTIFCFQFCLETD